VVAVQLLRLRSPWPWLQPHYWHLAVVDDVDDAAVVVDDVVVAVVADNTDDIVDEPTLPKLRLVLALVVAADVAAAIPCLDYDVRVFAGSHSPQLMDVVAGADGVDGAAEVGVAGDGAVDVCVVAADVRRDVAVAVVVVAVVAPLLLLAVPHLL
jgi:hypothetical protein